MKKTALALIFCLIFAVPSFAQNNMEGMRFLTINALMQYGQKLYDRGDFNEASAVFNRVLDIDGNQSQALQYLKKMGHAPALIQGMQTVDVTNSQSLKEAIEIKKQNIEKLEAQIKQMRANIASESLEAGKE